ncbi:MAG TPA: hypothetical protein VK387_06140, partial [Thermoleophilaceae bacterium]|nr:hypothetical protein [Thermoleophilaceae bacterium]
MAASIGSLRARPVPLGPRAGLPPVRPGQADAMTTPTRPTGGILSEDRTEEREQIIEMLQQ